MASNNNAQGAATSDKKKYRIKNGDTLAFPGLNGVTYTNEHLNGKDSEMIVRVMKKIDPKAFDKLIEEVK